MSHIHTNTGECDFTVTGFVVHNEKLLLIKHKKMHSLLPPGGHIEVNQSPIEALYTEILEEAGITKHDLELITSYHNANLNFIQETDSSSLAVPFDINIHDITTGSSHRHIDLAYILLSRTNSVKPETGESQEYGWYSKPNIQNLNDEVIYKNTRNRALWVLDFLQSCIYTESHSTSGLVKRARQNI